MTNEISIQCPRCKGVASDKEILNVYIVCRNCKAILVPSFNEEGLLDRVIDTTDTYEGKGLSKNKIKWNELPDSLITQDKWENPNYTLNLCIEIQKELPENDQTIYAGFWIRLIAWWIDSFIIFLGYFAISLFVNIIEPKAFEPNANFVDNPSALIPIIVLFVVFYCYYVFFETSKIQATPGILIFGFRVVDKDNKRIGILRENVRLFGKILTLITFGLGFLIPILASKTKQTLFDAIAGCFVVIK